MSFSGLPSQSRRTKYIALHFHIGVVSESGCWLLTVGTRTKITQKEGTEVQLCQPLLEDSEIPARSLLMADTLGLILHDYMAIADFAGTYKYHFCKYTGYEYYVMLYNRV